MPDKGKMKVLHVLGNGPSIKDDYSQILLEKTNEYSAFMVVNSFALTDLYEEIKPSFYVITDPAFYNNKTTDSLILLQQQVFSAIASKTRWKLTLFVHPNAKNHKEFLSLISNNNNIFIHYINNIPIIDGSVRVNNFLFKYQLANPLFQNVLIPAIFYGIQMSFSSINIWGADHSWHEDFILGIDNIVYTPDKHFYGSEKLIPHLNEHGFPVKVWEEFASLSRAFKIYVYLQSYSEYMSCKIVNRSSKTWIDAFERR